VVLSRPSKGKNIEAEGRKIAGACADRMVFDELPQVSDAVVLVIDIHVSRKG
jgi:hypothetical protein